jgi:type VI secretion system protein ImpH
MAGARGRTDRGLSERLFAEPQCFDFFQAVRILEHLAREQAGGRPGFPAGPVGQDHPPELEAVRFRSQPSLSFPPGPIVQVRTLRTSETASRGEPMPFVEMVVAFLGLIGPAGVLPTHYTTLLLQRIRDKDFALRDFFDIFHHRAIALFYRAWEKYRLPFAYERSRIRASGDDLVTSGLYCLTGMGTRGLRGRQEVDDEALLYYSGHFAHFPRSAIVLEGILADYFGLPIRVRQLQGQWLHLAASEKSRMPCPTHPRGLNNQVGVTLVVGERVWDIRGRFRLIVGPLSYSQFKSFLPNGKALRALCQLTRTYVGLELAFDVQLILRAEEVPGTQVGFQQTNLGWNSWIRTQPAPRDAGDAVFSIDSI